MMFIFNINDYMRIPIRWMTSFISMVIAISLLLFLCPEISAKEIIVTFRYDDYGNKSPVDLDLKIIEIFKRHGKEITFGVIPYRCPENNPVSLAGVPLTGEKIGVLNSAIASGTVEVALHGYCHSINAQDPVGGDSEFLGFGYDDQLIRLKKGKEYLENTFGVTVSTFIPPFNSYNDLTLKAMEKAGFQVISADRIRPATLKSKLKFLPKTCYLNEIKSTIELARKVPEEQSVVFALFHAYDLLPLSETHKMRMNFDEFAELFSWIVNQPDVRVLSIRETAGVVQNLSVQRYLYFQSFFNRNEFFPPNDTLNVHYTTGAYLEPALVRSIILRFASVYVLLFLASMGVSQALFRRMISRDVTWARKVRKVFVFAVLMVCVYVFRNFTLHFKGFVIVVLSLGMMIGSILPFKMKMLADGTIRHRRHEKDLMNAKS